MSAQPSAIVWDGIRLVLGGISEDDRKRGMAAASDLGLWADSGQDCANGSGWLEIVFPPDIAASAAARALIEDTCREGLPDLVTLLLFAYGTAASDG